MTLRNGVMVLGLITSTVAFAQESQKKDTTSAVSLTQESEKTDPIDVHEQRITTVEDGLFQLKKLKFSGYIQAQWQSSQLDSLGKKSNDMKVGIGTAGKESTASSYNRFGVRRGRLKATYEDFGCKAAIEFDISEGGLKTKDVYLSVLDPWLNVFTVKGGVFDNPFGYEIGYSSSSLESPERSRIIQTLFPDEKTMGAMITLQAPKTSPWNVLKLETGLVAGNAIYKDYKSKKDFVGRLSFSKSTSNIKYGIGVSGYWGSILQTTKKVYKATDNKFTVDSTETNLNDYAERKYFDVDGQFSIASAAGLSTIRAEYIMGTQPGSSSSSSSPNAYDPTTATASDTYIRDFKGGYITFVQNIADTKHSIVIKYDWYDPNTNLSSNNVKSKADMAYSTIGLGYIYRMNNNVKLTAYYDIVANEEINVKGYHNNVDDNVFTLRLQYKF